MRKVKFSESKKLEAATMYADTIDTECNLQKAFIHGIEWALENQEICWISVEERLPEEDGAYLVHLGPHGHVTYDTVCEMYFDHEKKDWYDPERWSYTVFVTHWMPLPEFKTEEDETI